ncbi:hypothetical protein KAH37_02135 [bacterium]|nr:hypothetical protein [bacterium]
MHETDDGDFSDSDEEKELFDGNVYRLLEYDSTSETGGFPSQFYTVNDKVIFSTSTDDVTELWATDGTAKNTQIILSYAAFDEYTPPIKGNNSLFFVSKDRHNALSIWRTDGTVEGTRMLRNAEKNGEFYLPFFYTSNSAIYTASLNNKLVMAYQLRTPWVHQYQKTWQLYMGNDDETEFHSIFEIDLFLGFLGELKGELYFPMFELVGDDYNLVIMKTDGSKKSPEIVTTATLPDYDECTFIPNLKTAQTDSRILFKLCGKILLLDSKTKDITVLEDIESENYKTAVDDSGDIYLLSEEKTLWLINNSKIPEKKDIFSSGTTLEILIIEDTIVFLRETSTGHKIVGFNKVDSSLSTLYSYGSKRSFDYTPVMFLHNNQLYFSNIEVSQKLSTPFYDEFLFTLNIQDKKIEKIAMLTTDLSGVGRGFRGINSHFTPFKDMVLYNGLAFSIKQDGATKQTLSKGNELYKVNLIEKKMQLLKNTSFGDANKYGALIYFSDRLIFNFEKEYYITDKEIKKYDTFSYALAPYFKWGDKLVLGSSTEIKIIDSTLFELISFEGLHFNFVDFGDNLLFQKCTDNTGCELWRTNLSKTEMIFESTTGTDHNIMLYSNATNNKGLAFQAATEASGWELFFIDKQNVGNVPILFDLNGDNTSSDIKRFDGFEDFFYLFHYSDTEKRVVKINSQGIVEKEIWLSPFGNKEYVYTLNSLDDSVIFMSINLDSFILKIYTIGKDDTITEIKSIENTITTARISDEDPPTIKLNNKLIFPLFNMKYGEELWVCDGTESGTKLLKDIFKGPYSSRPYFLKVHDDILYFGANSGEHGFELWRTDGTEEGTWMVIDLNEGIASSMPKTVVFMEENGVVIKAVIDQIGYQVFIITNDLFYKK